MKRFRRQELRVDSFELVEVGPGLALVRLAGEWRSETPEVVSLVATKRSGAAEELPALPEPPGDGTGLWRAAFSADGEVFDARFTLHTADGLSVELPAPVERGAPAPDTPEPEPDQADAVEYADPIEPVDAVEHAEALEHALHVERARAERTEESLREQLRIVVAETAEFMGRLEGYELRRAELEKELSWERLLHTETRRLLDDAEQQRDEAAVRAQDAAAARRQVGTARERIAELERRLEQQDELLRGVRATVDRGSAQLAGLEERLLALRKAGAGQPVGEPERLEQAWAEADRGSERLAVLERRLTELRAEIAP